MRVAGSLLNVTGAGLQAIRMESSDASCLLSLRGRAASEVVIGADHGSYVLEVVGGRGGE